VFKEVEVKKNPVKDCKHDLCTRETGGRHAANFDGRSPTPRTRKQEEKQIQNNTEKIARKTRTLLIKRKRQDTLNKKTGKKYTTCMHSLIMFCLVFSIQTSVLSLKREHLHPFFILSRN